MLLLPAGSTQTILSRRRAAYPAMIFIAREFFIPIYLPPPVSSLSHQSVILYYFIPLQLNYAELADGRTRIYKSQEQVL